MKIKNVEGKVLFTDKSETVKEALAAAVDAQKSLRYADLKYADLKYAYLRNADLRYADLSGADLRYADLKYAYLRNAVLRYADLKYAYLRNADLRNADLRYADLRYADLRNADLRYAYLRNADLRNAEGIIPERTNPLYMLFDQVGKIRAYKLVNNRNEGIYNGGTKYEIGKTVSEPEADTNPERECAAGINVATLDWCLREYGEGLKILIIEFTRRDIACIPYTSDGKFRLFRCKVVAEKDISQFIQEKK